MKLITILTISSFPLLLIFPGGKCGKITGGEEAVPHSRPFMAYLDGPCGGALIEKDWILTAARCNRNKTLKVMLGAHSVMEYENERQIIQSEKVVVHPDFNPSTNDNNLMLVKLSKKAVLNKFVSLLHLPAAARSPPGGTQCSIAGWGIMGYNGQLADKLQEINVAVIDRDICSGPDYLNKPIKSSMICAGHPNKKKAFCQGDYGGPLICDGTYTAIASYGFKCGENSKPGVYTLLTDNYLKWIKETIQKY
ncbi:granzyme A-like [Polypterus senegalus]|uniref:granzyme A-like n=1 Tax=Polypterus senegalus TaxID=55291 RepID=UPI001964C659|nr:granzyme A-like [Polypterus senegalus]